MTTTEKSKLIGVAVAAAVLGAGLLWVIWTFTAGADEEGIRVKNGSVVLETVSNAGFEERQGGSGKFKVKKDADGPIHIAVFDGVCTKEFFLANVTKVVLEVDAKVIDLVDNGEFAPTKEFTKSLDGKKLTHAGDIAKIEAFDVTSASDPVLVCTKADNVKMQAHLHISK